MHTGSSDPNPAEYTAGNLVFLYSELWAACSPWDPEKSEKIKNSAMIVSVFPAYPPAACKTSYKCPIVQTHLILRIMPDKIKRERYHLR